MKETATSNTLGLEDLVYQLEMRRGYEDQSRFLAFWLAGASPELLPLWLAPLLGRPVGKKVTVPALKNALFQRISLDLFEASREAGTDLSETLALLWPGGQGSLDLEHLVAALSSTSKAERLDAIIVQLDRSSALARDLVVRIATGRFRSPVTPKQVRSVLVEVFEKPLSDIEQNLANAGGSLADFTAWLLGNSFPEDHVVKNGFLSVPAIRREPQDNGTYDLCIPLPKGNFAVLANSNDACLLRSLAGDRLENVKGSGLCPEGATLLVYRPADPDAPLLTLDLLRKDGKDLRRVPREGRLAAGHSIAFARPRARTVNPRDLFDDPKIDRILLLKSTGTLEPTAAPLAEILRPPRGFHFKVLYAEGPVSRRGTFEGLLTLGAPAPASKGANSADLVPVGKTDIQYLPPEDRTALESYIADNTVERFGPVRKLAANEEKGLIAQVQCRVISLAPRRKAGLVLSEVKLLRLLDNSSAFHVSTLDELTALALL